MSIKDFDVNENIDRDQNHKNGDRKPLEKRNQSESDNANSPAKTEVKNAHATGDGSFGRNDGSIPETDEEQSTGENVY